MISINVKFMDGNVKSLTVSGHANYDDVGKDIVCAGVSAVVTGGVNALDKYEKYVKCEVDNGVVSYEVLEVEHDSQIVLKTILTQLETIEEAYKKYVKIYR